jgi:hypothetical protein
VSHHIMHHIMHAAARVSAWGSGTWDLLSWISPKQVAAGCNLQP